MKQLLQLKVVALDEQIDKLRETDQEVRANSTIGNKKAKAEEILKALNRRQSLGRLGYTINGDVDTGSGDPEMLEGQSEEEEAHDEDMGLDPDWNY